MTQQRTCHTPATKSPACLASVPGVWGPPPGRFRAGVGRRHGAGEQARLMFLATIGLPHSQRLRMAQPRALGPLTRHCFAGAGR